MTAHSAPPPTVPPTPAVRRPWRERHLTSENRWQQIASERAGEQAIWRERWIGRYSALLLFLTLLYMLIGSAPYTHGVTIDPATGGTEVSPINRSLWLALLGLAMPVLWLRRGQLLGYARLLWPEFLLFLWFALTTRWALDQATSNRRLILYLVTFTILSAASLGLRSAGRFHGTLAAAAAVVTLIDVFSWLALPGLSMTDIGLAGIHQHKNTLGASALFSFFVCAAYLPTRQGVVSRAGWGLIVVMIMALLGASLSKTSVAIAAVAAVVTPMLVLLARSHRSVLRLVAVTLVLVVFAAPFVYLAINGIRGTDPLAPTRGITFTLRTDVWNFTLGEYAAHPWGGVGFASFWDIDPRVQPSLQTDLWFAQPDAATNESHNGYLDLLVTTGLVGLAGSLALLGRWIMLGLILLRRTALLGTSHPEPALTTVLVVFAIAFAVHNLMESSYFTANALFGNLILLVGIQIVLRHQQATRPRALLAPGGAA